MNRLKTAFLAAFLCASMGSYAQTGTLEFTDSLMRPDSTVLYGIDSFGAVFNDFGDHLFTFSGDTLKDPNGDVVFFIENGNELHDILGDLMGSVEGLRFKDDNQMELANRVGDNIYDITSYHMAILTSGFSEPLAYYLLLFFFAI